MVPRTTEAVTRAATSRTAVAIGHRLLACQWTRRPRCGNPTFNWCACSAPAAWARFTKRFRRACTRAWRSKLLQREALDSPSRVRRFFAEARALARLRHPHIVGVHGIGRMADGRYFLVMDLVAGGTTFAALLKGDAVPFDRAAGLVATVAEAIDHAHSRGVIHRDLKPSNVLLDAAGSPHVTDFGLAKVFDAVDSGISPDDGRPDPGHAALHGPRTG